LRFNINTEGENNQQTKGRHIRRKGEKRRIIRKGGQAPFIEVEKIDLHKEPLGEKESILVFKTTLSAEINPASKGLIKRYKDIR